MKKNDSNAKDATTTATETVTDSAPESVATDDKNSDDVTTEQSAEPVAASESKSAEEEFSELQDRYLRAVAENENQRRRAEEKIANTRKYALTAFASNICEVCDCLEAVLSVEDSGKKMREGVTLTLRKLTTAMETNGIRSIRPDEGAPFDPNLHQSIGVAQNSNFPPQTVATLVQAGYTLNGRVIRAASILLNKAPEDGNNS